MLKRLSIFLLFAWPLLAQTPAPCNSCDDLGQALANHGMDAATAPVTAAILESVIGTNNALLTRLANDEATITALKAQIAAIPAGPKGDKGDTGAQGPQGVPGVCPACTPPPVTATAPIPILATQANVGINVTKWSTKQFSMPVAGSALVGCNFPVGTIGVVASDSNADVATALPTNAMQATFFFPNVAQGAVTFTCTASAAASAAEIYVTPFAAGVQIDDFSVPAVEAPPAVTGTITTNGPNETVWAFIVTGTATNAAGWTPLSQFDSNLVTYQVEATAGNYSAKFGVTQTGCLTLVALKSP